MRLQQLLEQSVSATLLNDSHRRFPILCFKQSDSIRLVLEKLADEGLVSALVVSDSAHADQDSNKTKDQNAEHRMFSRVLVNELKGFIDLSVILQHFLRRTIQPRRFLVTRAMISFGAQMPRRRAIRILCRP